MDWSEGGRGLQLAYRLTTTRTATARVLHAATFHSILCESFGQCDLIQ
jgi:hypothetical protein